jgi:hypothetical protein
MVNGEIIVHSHPFNNPGDTHTSSQYDLIKILSSFASPATLTGLLLAILFFGNQQMRETKPDSLSRLIYVQVWFRRGPPSTFFF